MVKGFSDQDEAPTHYTDGGGGEWWTGMRDDGDMADHSPNTGIIHGDGDPGHAQAEAYERVNGHGTGGLFDDCYVVTAANRDLFIYGMKDAVWGIRDGEAVFLPEWALVMKAYEIAAMEASPGAAIAFRAFYDVIGPNGAAYLDEHPDLKADARTRLETLANTGGQVLDILGVRKEYMAAARAKYSPHSPSDYTELESQLKRRDIPNPVILRVVTADAELPKIDAQRFDATVKTVYQALGK